MVALPSVGLSEDQKKPTAYSVLQSFYKLDSQQGHPICKLPESEKKFAPGLTYFESTFHHGENKTVTRFVYHPSLNKILEKHKINVRNCHKSSLWDANYLGRIKTECYLESGEVNNHHKELIECEERHYLKPDVNIGELKKVTVSSDTDCYISSTTPFKDNDILQKIFTRDECSDLKILNPKSE